MDTQTLVGVGHLLEGQEIDILYRWTCIANLTVMLPHYHRRVKLLNITRSNLSSEATQKYFWKKIESQLEVSNLKFVLVGRLDPLLTSRSQRL